jgi:hypothetical protein
MRYFTKEILWSYPKQIAATLQHFPGDPMRKTTITFSLVDPTHLEAGTLVSRCEIASEYRLVGVASRQGSVRIRSLD